MTSLWWDVSLTMLVYTITHTTAFAFGACWHHWHLDVEQAEAAANTEARP
jgi:hypothetical protein